MLRVISAARQLKWNHLVVGRHYCTFSKLVRFLQPISNPRHFSRPSRGPSGASSVTWARCNVTSTNRKWTETDNFINTSEFLRSALTGVSISSVLGQKGCRFESGEGEKPHRWDLICFLLVCGHVKLFLSTGCLHLLKYRCSSALVWSQIYKYAFRVVISIIGLLLLFTTHVKKTNLPKFKSPLSELLVF